MADCVAELLTNLVIKRLDCQPLLVQLFAYEEGGGWAAGLLAVCEEIDENAGEAVLR
jgi:hypothetical protein